VIVSEIGVRDIGMLITAHAYLGKRQKRKKTVSREACRLSCEEAAKNWALNPSASSRTLLC